MWRIRNTVTPTKERFDRALRLLPEAHGRAAQAAAEHLHRSVSEAARAAGHNPDVIELVQHPHAPFVGLSKSPEGDQVADVEYGKFSWDAKRRRQVYEQPSPTLRNSLRAQMPMARDIYHFHLRSGIGI